ncbi:MAG: hypothetical protein ACE5JQ_17605, partial [Candidatus Methylomirabilales bacterium]
MSPLPTGDSPNVQMLGGAIRRAQEYLLSLQHPEGFWLGELEADSTLTSEYIMLRHFLGRVDPDRERK